MNTQPPRRLSALLTAFALAVGACALPTALIATPPTTGTTVAAAASSLPWPARLAVSPGLKPETVALKGTGWQPMGTIEPVDVQIAPLHLGSRQSPSVTKSQDEDWALITARLAAPLTGVTPKFEQSGGFVFVPSFADDPATQTSSSLTRFRFVSARTAAPVKAGEPAQVVIERTWFTLYDPLPPRVAKGEPPATEAPPSKGLIVFLPGMFGTPTDQIIGLTRRMRQEGYTVLRMMSQPSRFTESITYKLALEGDITADVPSIAADLTDRAAEAAYAVESAVLYAVQERPELRGLPRLAVGMSGGAMLLPIVLSREPNAYAGAVSIAGGVDYLRILSTSNYANMIDAVRLRWTGDAAPNVAPGNAPPVAPKPSAKRLDELAALYRAAAPLDSVNLVGTLKTIPWLLIHGTTDKAVPASTGEELWELLGKPERIVIKGGHEWVFLTLSGKFDAIADWVNKNAAAPSKPARPEPAKEPAR